MQLTEADNKVQTTTVRLDKANDKIKELQKQPDEANTEAGKAKLEMEDAQKATHDIVQTFGREAGADGAGGQPQQAWLKLLGLPENTLRASQTDLCCQLQEAATKLRQQVLEDVDKTDVYGPLFLEEGDPIALEQAAAEAEMAATQSAERQLQAAEKRKLLESSGLAAGYNLGVGKATVATPAAKRAEPYPTVAGGDGTQSN